MACVCLMHMLIYEQNRCLLMILCVYLTPAPRMSVDVVDALVLALLLLASWCCLVTFCGLLE